MDKNSLLSLSCNDASDKKLDKNEVKKYSAIFPEWEIDDEGMLITTVELDNFQNALELVNEIGALSETEQHHPDILIHDYKYVGLVLFTHSSEGLTEKDFALAAKIDALFIEAE